LYQLTYVTIFNTNGKTQKGSEKGLNAIQNSYWNFKRDLDQKARRHTWSAGKNSLCNAFKGLAKDAVQIRLRFMVLR